MSDSENRIFLGNLDFDVTEGDIRNAFDERNIKIGEIRIPRKDDGRGKGFAFVDISENEPLSRDEVISVIAGTEILDRGCRASVAFDRQGHGGKRARKRDGGEGRSSERDSRRGGRRGSSEYGW